MKYKYLRMRAVCLCNAILLFMVVLSPSSGYSQADSRKKDQGSRDSNKKVKDVRYFGDSGLRQKGLHKFPELESVEIEYGVTITKDDLNYLSTLTTIEHLRIGQQIIDSPVTFQGDLKKLGKLKALKHLHLCKHDIKDADLEFIGSLSNLTDLEFNADSDYDGGGSFVSDKCGDYICKAKNLESIYVQGRGKLTDRFVSTITQELSELEHLNLHSPNLTDASLTYLANRCKKLKWLDMSSDKFTNKGIEQLSRAKHLEMLWVRSQSLTSDCVKHVANLQKLRHLELTVPNISDDSVQVLANLRNLEILALRQPALTDEQFSKFRNHPTLESGFLNGQDLSVEETIKVIGTIRNLSHLKVGSASSELQVAINRVLESRRRLDR